MLNERLGQAHFWLTLLGMNLTFFPMHFLGLYGMPRRVFTYADGLGFNGMNMVATFGSYLLGLGTLILFANMLWAARRGRIAGPNPWGASTLEWSIPSPPPGYNFREIPVVHSRMPLWESDPQLTAGIPHWARAGGHAGHHPRWRARGQHARAARRHGEHDVRARPGLPHAAAIVLADRAGLRRAALLRRLTFRHVEPGITTCGISPMWAA